MNGTGKFFNILQEQGFIAFYKTKLAEFGTKLQHHNTFCTDNARPQIDVRCEIDKFRGFLHDVLSFEPDFILQTEKPRLHYYDDSLK